MKSSNRNGRVLYLQHANPAAYPPLEYSSRILADAGWKVRFLGVHSLGSGTLEFPYHANIAIKVLPCAKPGWLQKLGYLRFLLQAVWTTLCWRPDWIYVSDSLAAPAALILFRLFGIRTLYHEHDSPGSSATSTSFMRMVQQVRGRLARISEINVLPQQGRLERFVEETGTTRPVLCVWNCPLRADVLESVRPERQPNEPLGVYFHGSINLERVPLTLIQGALLSGVPIRLRIVGYETIGSQGSIARLVAAVEAAGPLITLDLPGPVSRHLLRSQMEGMHVGWVNCLNPNDDINLKHFVGASVKSFDYLAAGLPLIIDDAEDWRRMFEQPGYAKSADPADAESIASALKWFYDNPTEVAAMGRNGRARILNEWNYESQFGPVQELMIEEMKSLQYQS
jgi:glycosyltransferase involved in cell wall biosynthesis